VVGVILIVAIVAFVLGAGALVYHYVAKFGVPDDSHSSVTVTETQSASENISITKTQTVKMTVTKRQTVYMSPKYDLTLKLPGKWQLIERSRYVNLSTLMSDDGFTARFRPIFATLYTPVDGYAEPFAGLTWNKAGRW
jgi:hypothetical protein